MLASLLQSCITERRINGVITGSDLLIPESSFQKNKASGHKQYVVIQNDQLQYPICLYRFSEDDYEALWMRCTHQGTELQVVGDMLECPAHGSEFSDRGLVLNGPATTSLRTFPVTRQNNQLKISLKKV